MAQLYVYFIVILLLTTSFWLKEPSSGQYLQRKLKMLVYITKMSLFWDPIYIHQFACFFAQQPPVGQGLLIHEVYRSHSDTPQSVGLLWASDRLVAETST
jgi:hypothetical protein